jgi:hypothetical protein
VKDAFSLLYSPLTTLTLPAKKKGKAPPAKKAKKGSLKHSLAESSSQTQGLSMLPTMPLDVLFEVTKKGSRSG